MSNYPPKYERGQHNVICAICQVTFKSGLMRKRWDGLLVCFKDYDPDPRPLLKPKGPFNDPRPIKNIQKITDDIAENN